MPLRAGILCPFRVHIRVLIVLTLRAGLVPVCRNDASLIVVSNSAGSEDVGASCTS